MLESFKRLLRLSEDTIVPDAESKRLARYELVEEINHGAFSRVFRAIDKHSKEEVAIKRMPKARLKPRQRENILREAAIHKRLKHRHIVQFIEFFETTEHYYLVLELMRGGELFARIEEVDTFTEEDARFIIEQVARAIKFLHDSGIVHRDIKPENLVFAGRSLSPVKLCDFGLSKIIETGTTNTPCGTVGYLAPEVAKEQSHAFAVDVWGLGCVLYALLCGFPAFYDQSVQVLTEKVKRGIFDFPSPWWDNVSYAAKDLIRQCLMVDPSKRITVSGFLAHPWVTGTAPPPPLPPAPMGTLTMTYSSTTTCTNTSMTTSVTSTMTATTSSANHATATSGKNGHVTTAAAPSAIAHHVTAAAPPPPPPLLHSPAVLRHQADHPVVRLKDVFDVTLAAQRGTESPASPSDSSLCIAAEKQPFMLGTIGQSALIGKRKKMYENAVTSNGNNTTTNIAGNTTTNASQKSPPETEKGPHIIMQKRRVASVA